MRIGFVGLGNMGGPMAANLVKADHEVLAYDLSPEKCAEAKSDGCKPVASVREAATNADMIILMLPNGDIVRQACAEIFAVAGPKTLIVDCSTIDVATAKTMNTEAEQKGLYYVDAPVSGGINGAKAATLTFMVGATESLFETVKPALSAMGQKIIRAGGAGAGQAAKACNNMLLAICMIGTSEAFLLAQRLGLDAQTFYDIASQSSGQNWALSHYCPVAGPVPNAPANRGYEGGFAAQLMLKDLGLSQEAAESVDLSTPLGATSLALYRTMVEMAQGGRDFSGIIETLAKPQSSEA